MYKSCLVNTARVINFMRFISLILCLAGGCFAGFVQADFAGAISQAALARTQKAVQYDGAYQVIPYPGGDVAPDRGVCTDVVIRVYRALDFDLQKAVHEDMQVAFNVYPSSRIWGLSRPDANIDHRRVPNLQTFFTRHGVTLPVTHNASDYLPGDIVTWMLPGNLPHIGIVVARTSEVTGRPMIVHNIGRGPALEDALFAYSITGHYRFVPDTSPLAQPTN